MQPKVIYTHESQFTSGLAHLRIVSYGK